MIPFGHAALSAVLGLYSYMERRHKQRQRDRETDRREWDEYAARHGFEPGSDEYKDARLVWMDARGSLRSDVYKALREGRRDRHLLDRAEAYVRFAQGMDKAMLAFRDPRVPAPVRAAVLAYWFGEGQKLFFSWYPVSTKDITQVLMPVATGAITWEHLVERGAQAGGSDEPSS